MKETLVSGESRHPDDIVFMRTNIPCQWACPALTDIPGYIQAIYNEDYDHADEINRKSNMLPSILGRICSRPCELACRHGEPDLGNPVSICHLKRFASDRCSGSKKTVSYRFPKTGFRVAVVGAGPTGLAASLLLTRMGHEVIVYEQMQKPGGMLMYGIPAFRLPRELIESEVSQMEAQGVKILFGRKIGRDIHLRSLMESHDAVLMALGCYLPRRMGVPGEELDGVLSGLDFMMRVNAGEVVPVGRNVIVIGGGFTAIDCARCARRLGADQVTICIRNVEEDLTVTWDEIHETKREGIKFMSLVSSIEVIGPGKVSAIRFLRNRFGGMRGSSGRKIDTIPGSEFQVNADTVIAAIGQSPVSDLIAQELHRPLTFDSVTGRSEIPNLFGAGDFVRGASTVIDSIGHARKVITEMDRFLTGKIRRHTQVVVEPASDTNRKRAWDFIPKTTMPVIPPEQRFSDPEKEVETGFDPIDGLEESKRCYLCNLKYEISIPDCIYCRWCIDVCPRNCIEMVQEINPRAPTPHDQLVTTRLWNQVAGIVIDSDRCIRCGECLKVCPTQCIFVSRIRLMETPL